MLYDRLAAEIGTRTKAFNLVKHDKKLVRFYIPIVPPNIEEPVWSVIRKLTDKIGENLTTCLREIAKENSALSGIMANMNMIIHDMELDVEAVTLNGKIGEIIVKLGNL